MFRLLKKIKYFLNFLLDFISKKLDMDIGHLITYFLSTLYSNNQVKNKLLIFGSTNGKQFLGNSKDLFLYLTKHSNYHCVWITASKQIFEDLKKQNYNVVLNRDWFRAIKILKMANYIFITHGFGDIVWIKFSPKTKLIHLEHGTALKKQGFDFLEKKYNIFQKILFKKLAKSIDYMIVPSEEAKKLKMSCFHLSSNKFIISGYPRNDILINYTKNLQETIKEKLNLKKDHEILLYAPTYRREYEYESSINKIFLEKLDQFLIKEKKIFLYKPHPFSEKIETEIYKNIISISPKINISDLLIITDLLITDYSGVFFDYLLTLRPIVFFSYDLDLYKDARNFYYDYESFVPGPIAKTGDELILILKNINDWNKKYEKKRKIIHNRFNKYSDGNSRQRIIKFLDLKLN